MYLRINYVLVRIRQMVNTEHIMQNLLSLFWNPCLSTRSLICISFTKVVFVRHDVSEGITRVSANFLTSLIFTDFATFLQSLKILTEKKRTNCKSPTSKQQTWQIAKIKFSEKLTDLKGHFCKKKIPIQISWYTITQRTSGCDRQTMHKIPPADQGHKNKTDWCK